MADSEREHDERLVRRLLRQESWTELERSGLVGDSADGEQLARELLPLWGSSGWQVTEMRVNGTRIDVRLQSDAGRRLLAVLRVNRSPSSSLVAATIYERPTSLWNGQPGRVVVLNGPSSVGKSSLMAAFADAAPTPWACVDEPVFGRLATKFLAWRETAGPTVEGFLAALGAAARVGNQLIVSAGGLEQERFREALVGIPTVYVGLDAPLEVLLERQLMQADKFGGLAEESVGIHDGWVYDFRINTTMHDSREAAELLSEFLGARDARTSRPDGR